MKNLLRKTFFGLLLLCAAVVAQAQSGYLVSNSNGTTLDTVSNAGNKSQKLPIAGAQTTVSIHTLLVSKTGTPAGVVRLYGSNTGVAGSFVRIPSQTSAGTFSTDSLVVNTNALNKVWVLHSNDYAYYQVVFTGSGTQSTTLANFAIWRK